MSSYYDEREDARKRQAIADSERDELRDSFARAALTGFVAHVATRSDLEEKAYARRAYAIADAMMAERERRGKT
jgi:hypothetical protein